jgi:probable biosynthetic protein (TIGR04098 family)
MPQMAAGGLSESWLFKEIGDFHWSLITDGLETPSSRLVDGNGERLYATFTRFELRSSSPLAGFVENERFSIAGSTSRFGAGIFLGDFRLEGRNKHVKVRVMSSFARRENADSNRGLVKGQPSIPDGCSITVLAEKPDLVNEYRRVRNTEFDGPKLFECDYQINPYHDINGVGLLYFAAYPTISDTGELAYANQGNGWASRFSTVSRDVYYFANSDAEDTLTYRLLSRVDHADGIELGALILRKNDQVPMAFIRTRKAAIPRGD